MKNESVRTSLVVLLISFIGLDFLAAISGRALGMLTLGVFFAQPLLLAVWTAWGPAHIVLRLLVGTGAAVLLAFLASAGFGGFRHEPVSVAIFVQWLSSHLLLALLRRLFGWQLVLGLLVGAGDRVRGFSNLLVACSILRLSS